MRCGSLSLFLSFSLSLISLISLISCFSRFSIVSFGWNCGLFVCLMQFLAAIDGAIPGPQPLCRQSPTGLGTGLDGSRQLAMSFVSFDGFIVGGYRYWIDFLFHPMYYYYSCLFCLFSSSSYDLLLLSLFYSS